LGLEVTIDRFVALNTTIFEFNPWELGSFDPTTFRFVPLEYIGSNFSAGVIPAEEGCVRGYDNAGYVMGTSSSLFNAAILELNALNASTKIQRRLQTRLNNLLAKLGDAINDIAIYKPNPFFGHRRQSNKNAHTEILTLVTALKIHKIYLCSLCFNRPERSMLYLLWMHHQIVVKRTGQMVPRWL
jgi:lysophospholipase